MTIGKFNVSYQESVYLLSEVKLLKDSKPLFNRGQYVISRGIADYREEYQFLVDNQSYDVILKDDSIFQFGEKSDVLRYAYYQSIKEPLGYSEFLSRFFEEDEIDESDLSFYEEYQQSLAEQGFRESPVLFRYDCSLKGYRPNIHSCSHIHFGRNNEIRVPCKLELTPLAFVLFIIKHCYLKEWESLLKETKLKAMFLQHKNECLDLPQHQWTDESEEHDLYLR